MNRFFNLIMLSIVEIFGDFALKEYAYTSKLHPLLIGVGWYGLVIYFLIQSLRGSLILYVNAYWDAFSAIFESAAAFFILGERFKNKWQYLGIGLIISGMFLLR